MGDFVRALEAFKNKVDERTDAVVKKVVIDIGTRLVLRSPVGDPTYWQSPPPPGYVGGRFRANWQYGLNSADRTVTDKIDPGKIGIGGTATISRLTAQVPNETAGNVHYITNSLPYGMRLEQGWSRQAPAGMVSLTELEFIPIVRQAAAQLT